MGCGQGIAQPLLLKKKRGEPSICAQTVSKLYICTLFHIKYSPRISTDNKSSIVFFNGREECCSRTDPLRLILEAVALGRWLDGIQLGLYDDAWFFFPLVCFVFCLLFKQLRPKFVEGERGGIERVIIDVYWSRQWWLPSGGVCLSVCTEELFAPGLLLPSTD